MKLSKSIAAGFLFVCVNIAFLEAFTHYKQNVEEFGADALERSIARPNVVFVGSSMVLYPLAALEATCSGPKPAGRLRYVENALRQPLNRDVQVNNVSYMGFMMSDNYFIVDHYLRGNHRPDVVVLLLAPRDFYDVEFETPAAGIAFRKLSNLSHIVEYCGTYLKQPSDYVDFAAGKMLITFAFRGKIQERIHEIVFADWDALQPKFLAHAKRESIWERSIREYSHRYQEINFDAMNKQFEFLTDLLSVCSSRGIKTIVINAPLTEANIELLPPKLYARYCSRLRQVTAVKGCEYVSFSNSNLYDSDDFSDSVHLNRKGAAKLIRSVLPNIVSVLNSNSDKSSKVVQSNGRNGGRKEYASNSNSHSTPAWQ